MAAQYSMRDVVRLAGLSRNIVVRLIEADVISSERTSSREYRFGFQALIMLRTARSLYACNVPPRRVLASLRRLRGLLPQAMPLSGLRICAQGSTVVVQEGDDRWQAESGQLLLDFDASSEGESTVIVERLHPARSEAARYFERACGLEDDAPEEARDSYRRAIECDPAALNAYINLGCLLHASKHWEEAEAVYRVGLECCEDRGTLYYNLAVLDEDRGRIPEALSGYASALAEDPLCSDAYFNLARLYSALGRTQEAVRAYNHYRRLSPGTSA